MIQIILYSYAPEYSVIIIRTHPHGHGMKIYNTLQGFRQKGLRGEIQKEVGLGVLPI